MNLNPSPAPPRPGTSEEDLAFREQCRRQMARSIEARMKYGFCRVHRPVLDERGVRVFSSTREYREWCAANLSAYLGFQPDPEAQSERTVKP